VLGAGGGGGVEQCALCEVAWGFSRVVGSVSPGIAVFCEDGVNVVPPLMLSSLLCEDAMARRTCGVVVRDGDVRFVERFMSWALGC
jgi:hypothetical protein